MIDLMGLLYEMERAGLATAADRRTKLKALYLEAAAVAARFGEVGKTASDVAADSTLAADSVLWSNDVDARIGSGELKSSAVDNAHALCPDAARKGRWTRAQVRALFGL